MNKSAFLILASLICVVFANSNSDFRIININDLKEEGSYLPVKGGQKFIIELEGNPTTGYGWFLEGGVQKLNKELITALNLDEKNSAEYYSKRSSEDESEIKRVGTGGLYHFKFQASENNSGEQVLDFVYKRPWTSEGEVKKSINVKIVNPSIKAEEL